MRAAGISLWRICAPYFGVGLLLSMAVLVLNEAVVPQTKERANRLRIVDAIVEPLQLVGARFVDGRRFAPLFQQLIADVQRHHHGDALEADHLAAVAHLAHLLVEVARRFEQIGRLLRRAGDLILLVEDTNHHGIGRAHDSCSSVRSRAIIASTLARAMSVFWINCSRSRCQSCASAFSARFS